MSQQSVSALFIQKSAQSVENFAKYLNIVLDITFFAQSKNYIFPDAVRIFAGKLMQIFEKKKHMYCQHREMQCLKNYKRFSNYFSKEKLKQLTCSCRMYTEKVRRPKSAVLESFFPLLPSFYTLQQRHTVNCYTV
jgi:hypothetical protein